MCKIFFFFNQSKNLNIYLTVLCLVLIFCAIELLQCFSRCAQWGFASAPKIRVRRQNCEIANLFFVQAWVACCWWENGGNQIGIDINDKLIFLLRHANVVVFYLSLAMLEQMLHKWNLVTRKRRNRPVCSPCGKSHMPSTLELQTLSTFRLHPHHPSKALWCPFKQSWVPQRLLIKCAESCWENPIPTPEL